MKKFGFGLLIVCLVALFVWGFGIFIITTIEHRNIYAREHSPIQVLGHKFIVEYRGQIPQDKFDVGEVKLSITITELRMVTIYLTNNTKYVFYSLIIKPEDGDGGFIFTTQELIDGAIGVSLNPGTYLIHGHYLLKDE